ncbi:MAG: orotate phosphoribosyltransferase [Candidatus Edwardsbacteria bacterium]
MLNQEEIRKIFEEKGVLKNGHFLLTSGRHSAVYFEKFQILQYPGITSRFCAEIAGHFLQEDISAVAGPTTGGIIIAFEVAKHLGCRAVYAEKVEKGRDFLRGMEIKNNERILVVDDVMTTGGSIKETLEAVKKKGGQTVGIGVFVDRSEVSVDFGIPLVSLLCVPTETFSPEKCPLCAKNIPLIKPGGSK